MVVDSIPTVANDEAERANTVKTENVIHSIKKVHYTWKPLPRPLPASPWVCDDRVTSDLSDLTISSSSSFSSELAAYNCHSNRTSNKSETLSFCFVHPLQVPSPSQSPSEHFQGRLIRSNAWDTADSPNYELHPLSPDFFRSRSHTSSFRTVDSDMKTLVCNNKSSKNRSPRRSPSTKQKFEETDQRNLRREYQMYSCPSSLFQNASESEQLQLRRTPQTTRITRKNRPFRSLSKSSSLSSQLSQRNNSQINNMNFLCLQDDHNDMYTSRDCIFSDTLTTFTNLFICGS